MLCLVHNLGRKLTRGCCLRSGWPPFAGRWAIALCIVSDILFHLSILMLCFPLWVWSFKTLKTVVISAPKSFLFFPQFCLPSHWGCKQMSDCVMFSYLPHYTLIRCQVGFYFNAKLNTWIFHSWEQKVQLYRWAWQVCFIVT